MLKRRGTTVRGFEKVFCTSSQDSQRVAVQKAFQTLSRPGRFVAKQLDTRENAAESELREERQNKIGIGDWIATHSVVSPRIRSCRHAEEDGGLFPDSVVEFEDWAFSRLTQMDDWILEIVEVFLVRGRSGAEKKKEKKGWEVVWVEDGIFVAHAPCPNMSG